MLPDDDRPPELRAHWRAVARRPWLVALCALVGATAMWLAVDRAQPTYIARVQLEILPVPGSWISANQTYTEAVRFQRRSVVEAVAERDGDGPDWLARPVFGTTFVNLEVEASNRRAAEERATAVVDAYLTVRSEQLQSDLATRIEVAKIDVTAAQAELDRVLGGATGSSAATAPTREEEARRAAALGGTPVEAAQRRLASAQRLLAELREVEAAGPAAARVEGTQLRDGYTPDDPGPRSAAAGLVGGTIVGLGACLVLERLRDRVRSRRDAAAAAAPVPVLAVVPATGKGGAGAPLTEAPSAAATEALAALGASLGRPVTDGQGRVVVVAAVDDGPAAADLAAALATVLATPDTRVIALDADLRTPTLHALLDVHERPGLADAVTGGAANGAGDAIDARAVVQPVAARRGLWAVPAGGPVTDVAAVLTHKRTESLLDTLRARVDWVVVHAAPVLHAADTVAVGAVLDPERLDGVLLVARAGQTTHRRLGDALDSLASASVPVLGVVVTGAAPADCPAFVDAGRAGGR